MPVVLVGIAFEGGAFAIGLESGMRLDNGTSLLLLLLLLLLLQS